MTTLDWLCLSFAGAVVLYAAICIGAYLDGYFGGRRR